MENHQIGCSIIIPTWNRQALLERALRSVQKAKKEHDVEIIVIDNASTPPACVDEFPDLNIVLIRREKNEGPAIARNIGIEKARHNIIFPLDDDDELTEDAIDVFLDESILLHMKTLPVMFLACSISNLKNQFEIYTLSKYLRYPPSEIKPLINKKNFLAHGAHYPHSKIGAEGLLWTQLLNHFHLPVINKVVTISHQDADLRLTDIANQLNQAAEYMNFQKELILLIDKMAFSEFYKKRMLAYTCYAILAKKKSEAFSFLRKQKLKKIFLFKNLLLLLLPTELFKFIFHLYRLNSKLRYSRG